MFFLCEVASVARHTICHMGGTYLVATQIRATALPVSLPFSSDMSRYAA